VAGKGSGGFNVGSLCHDICDKKVAGDEGGEGGSVGGLGRGRFFVIAVGAF